MSEPIITKRCPKCKQIKSISDFFKNKCRKDGYTDYCKPCRHASNEKYRHTTKGQISQKKYRQSNNRKQVLLRYKINNREKINTRAVLNYNVQVGKLPKPETLKCSLCHKQAKEYHHHNGYRPKHRLDVIALCIDCHHKI